MGVEGFARNKINELADVVFSVEVKAKFGRNAKDVVKITAFASGREGVKFGLQM